SASAYSAVAALNLCKENGIAVPGQIAIVGFANEPFTSFCDPPMSAIDQQSMQIGNAAAEIFLEQINVGREKFVPKRIVLIPELIVRKSSLKHGVQGRMNLPDKL